MLLLLAVGTIGHAQPWTDDELLDDLELRTFRWFWETAHPTTGLTPDRAPLPPFTSVAAAGFGLTAYAVGAERGFVTRTQAAARTRTALQFLRDLPQGPAEFGTSGYRGFFYHFIGWNTGLRIASDVELSSVDTAWLMMGALFSQAYFDGDAPDEVAIRALADELYRRVEWDWMVPRPPRIAHGWKPTGGFLPYDYGGYDESMALYVLALGSPTHPVHESAWPGYTASYRWAGYYGQEHVNCGPLFGHHYTHAWIDFRGIQDAYMRGKGIDYHENSRRATYAQRAYAIANPGGWTGYDADVWGLTACDGPANVSLTLGGRLRRFYAYTARGTASNYLVDDGTIAPTAAASSVAFAPEIAIPAIRAMRTRYGDAIYLAHGFVDAFNPTFTATNVPLAGGRVVPGVGWVDTQHIGIDQGPILLFLANHRSDFVWRIMQRSPYLVAGLQRAGFTGGWLATAPKIVTPPANVGIDVGGVFHLEVEAEGAGPLAYRWFRDGAAIDGAVSRVFRVGSAAVEHSGAYTAEVRNANGAVMSAAAQVQVHPSAATLLNVSVRGRVGEGDATLIAGCVSRGSGALPVLVRVVGPSLESLGLPADDLLSDPRLAVRRLDGFGHGSNDDWSNQLAADAVAVAGEEVGAFPLDWGSKDAATLFDVPSGLPITVVSSGASPGTGIALAEIYAREGLGDIRLANLSARGFVGTGNAVLIPGFYLSPGGTCRLLVRAVGPSLDTIAPDLRPLLVDPLLVVRQAPGGAVVIASDDWEATGEGEAIAAAAELVGAFPLRSGSRDAALILTVGPSVPGQDDRGFTIVVAGAHGGSGIALVEIYLLPSE